MLSEQNCFAILIFGYRLSIVKVIFWNTINPALRIVHTKYGEIWNTLSACLVKTTIFDNKTRLNKWFFAKYVFYVIILVRLNRTTRWQVARAHTSISVFIELLVPIGAAVLEPTRFVGLCMTNPILGNGRMGGLKVSEIILYT